MTADLSLEEIEREYRLRQGLLASLAMELEAQTRVLLTESEHIDRIYFRAKDAKSFAKKSVAVDENGQRKYLLPFEDIEDQVAGRVLVFFRRDIDLVVDKLMMAFNRAEHVRKALKEEDAFAYESEHLVFIIPPQVLPPRMGGACRATNNIRNANPHVVHARMG